MHLRQDSHQRVANRLWDSPPPQASAGSLRGGALRHFILTEFVACALGLSLLAASCSSSAKAPVSAPSASHPPAVIHTASFAYVTDGANPGTVTSINLDNGHVGTAISLSTRALRIAVAPNGNTAYVTDGAHPGTITPVNLARGKVETPISVPDGADGIAVTADGTTAYVANGVAPDGGITPINLATGVAGTPIPVPDGADMPAISPNGHTVYVSDGRGSVDPISLPSGQVGTPISIPYGGSGTSDGIAVSPDGHTMYVTHSTGITPVNLATGTDGPTIPLQMVIQPGLGGGQIAVMSDGNTAYVTSGTDVIPVDLAHGTLGSPLPTLRPALDIAISGAPVSRITAPTSTSPRMGVLGSLSPGSSTNDLNAISCTGPTFCMAAGADSNIAGTSDQGTLVEQWNGTAWSVVSSPNPGNNGDTLTGISCTSATLCVAVGSSANRSGYADSLVEQWDGTAWSVVSSPKQNTGSYGNYLNAVSCTSATFCMAAGADSYAPGHNDTLVESWDGTAWSVVSSPNPGSSSNDLNAISCTSPTFCLAAGNNTTASGQTETLVAQWKN